MPVGGVHYSPPWAGLGWERMAAERGRHRAFVRPSKYGRLLVEVVMQAIQPASRVREIKIGGQFARAAAAVMRRLGA